MVLVSRLNDEDKKELANVQAWLDAEARREAEVADNRHRDDPNARNRKTYTQTVSIDSGLTWEILRDGFLAKKWPGEDFSQEPRRKKNTWQFATPGEVTEVRHRSPIRMRR